LYPSKTTAELLDSSREHMTTPQERFQGQLQDKQRHVVAAPSV